MTQLWPGITIIILAPERLKEQVWASAKHLAHTFNIKFYIELLNFDLRVSDHVLRAS